MGNLLFLFLFGFVLWVPGPEEGLIPSIIRDSANQSLPNVKIFWNNYMMGYVHFNLVIWVYP